jgi:photosynthetic reaction center H subunit
MDDLETTETQDEAAADATPLRAVPDLCGIRVDDSTGIRVGTLYGALAEADTGLLRYVDLALDALDRHVLVPIGHTRVRARTPNDKEPHVRLRAALLEELERIPPFPADVSHVTDPFERALLEAYGRTFHGERYYAHPAYDHEHLYVGEHSVVGPLEEATTTLARLAFLPGWHVAEGEPDIRRWSLLPGQGEPFEIIDLVVEPAAGKARYVVLAHAETGAARLLPVGYLQIDAPQGSVHAPGLTAADLLALPEYDGGGVSRADEDQLAAVLRARLAGRRRYALADYRLPENDARAR